MTTMSYIRTSLPATPPQLLQVAIGEHSYRFSIVHAGYEIFPAGPRESRREGHAHDVYHIVLYTEGEGQFLLHGVTYPYRPGTLVITAPGEPHAFPPLTPAYCAYLEVTFEYVHAEQYLCAPFTELLSAYAGTPMPSLYFPIALDPQTSRQLEERIRALLDALQASGALAPLRVEVDMAALLLFLTQAVFVPADSGTHAEEAWLARVKGEIELRFRDVLTVPILAESAGVSAGYFSRAFKRRFGISPIAYQQELRISAARNLLLTTNLPCKEIAARTGYADEFYFSKVFKRAVGQPPLMYRKIARK